MRISNLNPAHDIGASSWLIDIEGHRLLLDAGTHPKREGRDALPLYERIPAGELDAIVISHCHHDHVGSLPIAARRYPGAHVLMTELSYFLVERVLHNSVNVMVRQRDELGIREYPLYSHDEVDDLIRARRLPSPQLVGSSVPVDLTAMLVIGSLAAAVTGRATVQVSPNWAEPVNLYLVTAMRSGSGKRAAEKLCCWESSAKSLSACARAPSSRARAHTKAARAARRRSWRPSGRRRA